MSVGNVALWRFDEIDDGIRPADSIGHVAELDNDGGLIPTPPALVDAALGRGRRFIAGDGCGYAAKDVVAGSTLLTRDMSIQVMLNWQLGAQNTYAEFGTIYAHGKGDAPAEYLSAGLELRVVNLAANVGEIRWLWQDTAGTLHTQLGGHFYPSATEYLLLTATRRWVSSGEVVLRYYLADQLLAEVTTVDGDIAGGTTGTTSIGTRYMPAFVAWRRFFDGTIDELRVVDYELTAEEIAGTWRRITVHQPSGYQLFKELHDPGFPISKDPGSRVQRETRMIGYGLGYAAAQAENLRNILPSRAYGSVLADWEDVTKQAPKPGDSVDTRRARVVARMRRTEGVSIPGVDAALSELVDTDVANLEIMAFDQTITDNFATLDPLRWWSDPSADWTIVGGALKVAAIAGDFTAYDNFKRNLMSVGGDGRGVQVLTKVTPTTLPTGGAGGIIVVDNVNRNAVVLVLSKPGNYFVDVFTYTAGVQVANPVHVDLGVGAPAAIWLHLNQQSGTGFGGGPSTGPFVAGYSLTGPTTGYVYSAPFTHWITNQWAGHVFMATAVTAGASDVRFDDTQVRAPNGQRSFYFYVYRNPALPGRPDLVGANHIIRQLKQAHTWAAVITNKQTLCDDATTPCDAGPLGGI